jgi:hypothetical protein
MSKVADGIPESIFVQLEQQRLERERRLGRPVTLREVIESNIASATEFLRKIEDIKP